MYRYDVVGERETHGLMLGQPSIYTAERVMLRGLSRPLPLIAGFQRVF